MNPGLALCCTIQHPWHDQNGVLFDPLNRAIRDSFCMVCWNMETETGQVCRSERTISCCIRLGHIDFVFLTPLTLHEVIDFVAERTPIPSHLGFWVFHFFEPRWGHYERCIACGFTISTFPRPKWVSENGLLPPFMVIKYSGKWWNMKLKPVDWMVIDKSNTFRHCFFHIMRMNIYPLVI